MLTVGVFGITLTYISELSEELVVVAIVVWGETVPNENESNFEAAKCIGLHRRRRSPPTLIILFHNGNNIV